jgi:DNA methylase.
LGSGTTAMVAEKLNRNSIGFEINIEYLKTMDIKLGLNKNLIIKYFFKIKSK